MADTKEIQMSSLMGYITSNTYIYYKYTEIFIIQILAKMKNCLDPKVAVLCFLIKVNRYRNQRVIGILIALHPKLLLDRE